MEDQTDLTRSKCITNVSWQVGYKVQWLKMPNHVNLQVFKPFEIFYTIIEQALAQVQNLNIRNNEEERTKLGPTYKHDKQYCKKS